MLFSLDIFNKDKVLTIKRGCVIILKNKISTEESPMSRIKTIETKDIKNTVKAGGCGECQTSCQSACKTSCGVANQQCENNK